MQAHRWVAGVLLWSAVTAPWAAEQLATPPPAAGERRVVQPAAEPPASEARWGEVTATPERAGALLLLAAVALLVVRARRNRG